MLKPEGCSTLKETGTDNERLMGPKNGMGLQIEFSEELFHAHKSTPPRFSQAQSQLSKTEVKKLLENMH